MSHKHCREDGKVNSSKNLSVVSKCLAIVLIPKTHGSSGNVFENDEADETVVDPIDGNIIQSSEVRKALSPTGYSGKELLQDFKIRNKTCYWNPSLVESIKNLEFKGFVEPCTILVTAEDIHLENLRSAWARRVLKAPAGFVIERIGDVNGIEMQVIPQTQFIPLPDAVCSIIMDLNTRRIVATMEVIWEKLTVWYKHMTVPSQQLLFDILGSLIRDRKVFHTGSGYFVVTPDTNRLQNGGSTNYLPTNASWLPYHPMYVPVFQGQVNQQQLPMLPSRAHMRSISCQVTTIEESSEEETTKERKKDHDRLGRAGFDTKSSRSDSLKRRDGKDDVKTSKVVKRDTKVNTKELGDFKRSSSLKVKGEKVAEDANLKPNNLNPEKEKREKTSIFSRLFSRKKKHKEKDKALMPPPPPPPPPPSSVVPSHMAASSCEALSEGRGEKEYGTFSAQFPPPEWVWYHQQLERQKRTETWISQQTTKDVTAAQPSKVIARPPAGLKHNPLSEYPEEHTHGKSGKQVDYMAMRVSGNQKDKIITNNEATKQPYDGEFVKPHPIRSDNLYESFRNPSGSKQRHHHRKSRDFEKGDEDNKHQHASSEYAVIDQGDTTSYHDSNVYHSVSALSPVAHLSDESTYAKLVQQQKLGPLHSTPRCETLSDHRAASRLEGHELRDRLYRPPGDPHKRKSHRTRRRPHRAYSCYDGHGDDISYEYHGRLPNKNSSRAQSRDSGVNCVGQTIADDHDKREPGPLYENTSNKQYPPQGNHYQNRHSQHPHSSSNHVRFEMNNTAASDTTNINVMYLTDCNINSIAYQSDVTNQAYNSVVYGSNVTDITGGPSVIYHTITNSHLDSSELPMPQNSLQSAFYSESCLDMTPSNAITCKAEINAKASQEIVELYGSPDTLIVDVLGSSVENEMPSSPGIVLEHVAGNDKSEECASSNSESNQYENRLKTTEDAAANKDACCENAQVASDVDYCVSNRGKENEQDSQPSPLLGSKSSEEMYSQSAFVPAVRRQDVVSGRDNLVSDSGFSSPRNPQKPSDRRTQTSNISNSTSENSDGLCHQESTIYSQHSQHGPDNGNTDHCFTNGSNIQHSNDVCLTAGSEQHKAEPTHKNVDFNHVEQENFKQSLLFRSQQPKVKQSSSLNSIKSHSHVQHPQPIHPSLSQHSQPAAKIVPHPDIYNSTANIMYVEPSRPARVPLYAQSLNHQKPLHKHPKKERPRSVDLWKSNKPTDLHKFEEEQLSKKYGANGEFEVMGVL